MLFKSIPLSGYFKQGLIISQHLFPTLIDIFAFINPSPFLRHYQAYFVGEALELLKKLMLLNYLWVFILPL